MSVVSLREMLISWGGDATYVLNCFFNAYNVTGIDHPNDFRNTLMSFQTSA